MKNYQSVLTIYETQTAIGLLKQIVEKHLSKALNIKRVSAPLFVKTNSGLNDNLNGFEQPVSFSLGDEKLEIVHSLAKWKRLALKQYGFNVGEGLYTDMNAIRKDEELDAIHSIYVDQWDWEKVISESDRNLSYLKETVTSIVHALHLASVELQSLFPKLTYIFPDTISFVTSQELEDLYPTYTSKERENAYVLEHGLTFLIGIGKKLKSGKPHDGRAPDYDDWDLNGDILAYNPVLNSAFEISSMGIRVNSTSLKAQLKESGKEERSSLPFHQALLNNQLPQTIGGGIGESRISMLFLQKAHIGEVQVSVWDEKTKEYCKNNNINLL